MTKVKEDVKKEVKTKEAKPTVKKEVDPEALIKKMNIYEKMAAITDEMGVVNKAFEVKTTDGNGQKTYRAVSERDVIDAVKKLEKKYRVYSYPADRTLTDMDYQYYENKKPTSIRVEVNYRFVNLDKPEEFVDIKSYGDGIDRMDKAPGKAMTYADKYALMKAYKISTGDDPDEFASCTTPYGSKQKVAVKPKPAEVVVEKVMETGNKTIIPDELDVNAVFNKAEEVVENIKKATKEQIEKIKSLTDEDRRTRMCGFYKVPSVEELDEKTAELVLNKLEKENKIKEAKD